MSVTFHGGEPLLAGAGYFRMALEKLAGGPRSRWPAFAAQSNLWLLDEELCEIFLDYEVSIGTSLDGPEPINDAQRGKGYFRRTMEGIELARSHGLKVGCVCTFTSASARRAREVLEFFRREGLDFTIHPALPGIGPRDAGDLTLPPEAYGELLVELFEFYMEGPGGIRISTLDSLCRGISARRGGICIFGECLGGYLAVGPEGDIYPCQRFAGKPEHRLGNVAGQPAMEALRPAASWGALRIRQEQVRNECGGCAHLEYCLGGCPYNVVAARGDFSAGLRDPYCAAYKRVFEHVIDLALEEVFSPENIAAVIDGNDPGAGLLRKGRLLDLMKGGERRC